MQLGTCPRFLTGMQLYVCMCLELEAGSRLQATKETLQPARRDSSQGRKISHLTPHTITPHSSNLQTSHVKSHTSRFQPDRKKIQPKQKIAASQQPSPKTTHRTPHTSHPRPHISQITPHSLELTPGCLESVADELKLLLTVWSLFLAA